MTACMRPAGYAAMPGDCDDAQPAVHPGLTDICDGIDNDCDGVVDPASSCDCTIGATRSCGTTDAGECAYGMQACVGGHWGVCSGNVEPRTETCDGLDDDCDGSIDEGLLVMR